MKGYSVLFLLAIALTFIGAMDEPDQTEKWQPISLREHALNLIATEASQKIYDGTIASDGYLKLPQDLSKPLLAEIGRQLYLNYDIAVDTGASWGVSVAELQKAGRLPKIEETLTTLGRMHKTLNLSNLCISSLEGLRQVPDIQTVTHLDLNGNKLRKIPPYAFNGFGNLQQLFLYYNQIRDIAPKAFFGLNALNFLALMGNKIQHVSAEEFANLPRLEYLILQSNQISSVGSFEGVRSLKSLNLAQNKISSVPDKVRNGLGNLQYLNLSGNPLSEALKQALKSQFGDRVTFRLYRS